MRTRLLLPLMAAVAVAPAFPRASGESGLGSKLPEFDAVQWFNTVPISASDLQDKTVLIEVFRTL